MKVKQTYLSIAIPGDILMYRVGEGDVLGWAIATGSGNKVPDRDGDGVWDKGYSKGDYTHCALVTEAPDPEAKVREVRPNIYEVEHDHLSGLRCHSTWPVVKEELINWSDKHMELWRIRALSRLFHKKGEVPEIAKRMVAWARARKGKPYDWLFLATFGLVGLSGHTVCSKFLFNCAKDSSLDATDPSRYVLSPEGIRDGVPTPNDMVNSIKMIRMTFQGMLRR